MLNLMTTRRYVVVESDGVTAASWQRGSNNVLALQMTDEEVEVYDNWWVTQIVLVVYPAAVGVVWGERSQQVSSWACLSVYVYAMGVS